MCLALQSHVAASEGSTFAHATLQEGFERGCERFREAAVLRGRLPGGCEGLREAREVAMLRLCGVLCER